MWFSTILVERNPKDVFQRLEGPCSHICTEEPKCTADRSTFGTSGETPVLCWHNHRVPGNPS